MKKVIVAVILCAFMSLNAAEAKTTFLPKANNSIGAGKRVSSSTNNAARCFSSGYIYTTNSGCGELLDVCPEVSSHYRHCCPQGFRYTIEQCQAMGKLPVSSDTQTCGYYKCE